LKWEVAHGLREDFFAFLDDQILGRNYLDFVCRTGLNPDTGAVELVLDDDGRETFVGTDQVRGLLDR
jgi:hypothetical protein